MAAIPIITLHNVTYIVVLPQGDGLYLAKAQSDVHLQAYGRSHAEALEKLRRRIAAAEDRAA